MKKLFITLSLCCCLITTMMPTAAFATANDTTQNGIVTKRATATEQALNTLSTEAIAQNIEENMEAAIVDQSGTELALEVVDVEVDKISEVQTLADTKAVTYAATAKVKTTKQSYKKNGISATGYLSMKWTDGKGANNKINALTGHWAIAKGTFVSGKLFWGTNYTILNYADGQRSVKQSFNEPINYKSKAPRTGRLQADAWASIKSPKDGKRYSFTTKVVPTIFS